MRSRQSAGIVASPVLVGAATMLVALVAVFLAYNANNGLPFVPTYRVTASVPDAAELVRGNEVRIGGKRVGAITAITPRRGPGGRVWADLSLRLDVTARPLPWDTRVTVRPRSTLGLKYLELRPGRARAGVPDGGRLPPTAAGEIVELDEVLNAFDRETRAGLRGVLVDLGGGLAGRGESINRAIAALPRLAGHAEPVARNLRLARTDLAGFVEGLASAAAAVAPVRAELGGLVDGAVTTLAALGSERGSLDQVLAESPATVAVAQRALARVRPVLGDAAAIARDAAPGVALLPLASRRLAAAVETGTPVLRRATALADRLGETLAAADALVRDPAAEGSIRKLTDVVRSLEPTLRFVGPFQTRCNYLGLWTRNASSAISEGDENGNWFRFIAVGQSSESVQSAEPAPELHVTPYPATGQDGECEAGNEPWRPGRLIGNPPGRQAGETEPTAPPAGVGRR